MNNDIEIISKIFSLLNCEFQVLNNSGNILFESEYFNKIKNDSSIVENNIIRCLNKYYEFSRKNLEIDANVYYINLFTDVTYYESRVVMLKEDALTTLPNRYAIDSFLSNNAGSDYIVVICDIDDFKYINDTFGHQQGDIVLREFGKILKREITQNNYAGRYGGEEFLLFFKEEDFKKIKDELSYMRKQIIENPNLTNDKYSIKFSAGMAMTSDFNTIKETINAADTALYFVKNNGKNADGVYNIEDNMCYIIE